METADVRTASRKLLTSDVEVHLGHDLSHVVVDHPETVETRGLLRQEDRSTILRRRHERRRLVRSRRRGDIGADSSNTTSRVDLEQLNLETGETEPPDRLAVVHGSEGARGTPLLADPSVDLSEIVSLTDSVESVAQHGAVEVAGRIVARVHHRSSGGVRVLERRTSADHLSLLEEDRRVVLVVRSKRNRERARRALLRSVEDQQDVASDVDIVLDVVDRCLENPVGHVMLEVGTTKQDRLVADHGQHVSLRLVPDERDTDVGSASDRELVARSRRSAVDRDRGSRRTDVAVGVGEGQLDRVVTHRVVGMGRTTVGRVLGSTVAPLDESGDIGAVRIIDRPRCRGRKRTSTAGGAQVEVLSTGVVLNIDRVLGELGRARDPVDLEDVAVLTALIWLGPGDLHTANDRLAGTTRTRHRNARIGRRRERTQHLAVVDLRRVVLVLDDLDLRRVERLVRVHLDVELDDDTLRSRRRNDRVGHLTNGRRCHTGTGGSTTTSATSAAAATCSEYGKTHHNRDGSDDLRRPVERTLHFFSP